MDKMTDPFANDVKENSAVQYTMFASVGLLTYECLITFGDEVTFFWQSKWSSGKLLFLATRYLGFIDFTLILVYLLDPDLGIERCNQILRAYSYLTFGGIVIAEVIMSLRVFALWGRKRYIGLVLISLLFIEVIAAVVVYARLWNPVSTPSVPGITLCLMSNENIRPEYIGFAFLMAFECVILLLTFGVFRFWYENCLISRLLVVFFRDGAVYFIFLFALSTANLVIWLRQRPSNGNLHLLLVGPQRVLHSVITARMIANLRKITTETGHGPTTFSNMNFPVGTSNTQGWERPQTSSEGTNQLQTYINLEKMASRETRRASRF